MVCSVPLRILLLCLLHFSSCAVGEDVDPKILMGIVNKFEKGLVKEQYAVVFRVEKKECLEGSDFPRDELLNEVKAKFEEKKEGKLVNEVYRSDDHDLIAAKADKGLDHHSEFRLKNYLKAILDVKDKCVVYFTVNSPCLKKCLNKNNPDNIIASLELLEKYEGIKALAFKIIWREDKDKDKETLLKEIPHALPYYQCEENKDVCKRFKK